MVDEQEIVAKRTKGTIWSDRKGAAALLLLRRLVIVGPQTCADVISCPLTP